MELGKCFARIARLSGFNPGELEVEADHPANRRIIVNDENLWHHRSVTPVTPPPEKDHRSATLSQESPRPSRTLRSVETGDGGAVGRQRRLLTGIVRFEFARRARLEPLSESPTGNSRLLDAVNRSRASSSRRLERAGQLLDRGEGGAMVLLLALIGATAGLLGLTGAALGAVAGRRGIRRGRRIGAGLGTGLVAITVGLAFVGIGYGCVGLLNIGRGLAAGVAARQTQAVQPPSPNAVPPQRRHRSSPRPAGPEPSLSVPLPRSTGVERSLER